VHLTVQTVQWIAIGAAIGALVALLLALVVGLRLRRVRRAYAQVAQAAEGGDLLAQLADQRQELTALRDHVTAVAADLSAARTDLTDAVQHVAVVRYDAFSDMGGRMSFSAALLDDAGDGLVLTSINGRSETRSYAKGVKAGASDSQLSPEETQAIGFALRGTSFAKA
jgi:gas vesicle protein